MGASAGGGIRWAMEKINMATLNRPQTARLVHAGPEPNAWCGSP